MCNLVFALHRVYYLQSFTKFQTNLGYSVHLKTLQKSSIINCDCLNGRVNQDTSKLKSSDRFIASRKQKHNLAKINFTQSCIIFLFFWSCCFWDNYNGRFREICLIPLFVCACFVNKSTPSGVLKRPISVGYQRSIRHCSKFHQYLPHKG